MTFNGYCIGDENRLWATGDFKAVGFGKGVAVRLILVLSHTCPGKTRET